ncbi:MAG: D-alanine--D-alanine ligase [Candidatus Neomarinimicrobiota bacterium]
MPGRKQKRLTVGLTYDRRSDYLALGYGEEETAEFDRDDTITALDTTLLSLGYATDHIGHVRNLIHRLDQGERWDLVFNIAEGLYGVGREALVPALLDAYRIPYVFSDPLVLAVTLHKGMTKRIIRDLGLPTPDFAVVENETELAAVDLPFPLFVKPVAEGTGKGISEHSLVSTKDALQLVCRSIWQNFRQPALVESYLAGREYTVGVVGTGPQARAVGVMEVTMLAGDQDEIYSYENKEFYEERVRYVPCTGPEAAAMIELSLAVWRGLGCRDGGRVDLRCDEHGKPNFLEVNPLAGLHPRHSDLPILSGLAGLSYADLLRQIMESACERL